MIQTTIPDVLIDEDRSAGFNKELIMRTRVPFNRFPVSKFVVRSYGADISSNDCLEDAIKSYEGVKRLTDNLDQRGVKSEYINKSVRYDVQLQEIHNGDMLYFCDVCKSMTPHFGVYDEKTNRFVEKVARGGFDCRQCLKMKYHEPKGN